jgi:hypothetical protein
MPHTSICYYTSITRDDDVVEDGREYEFETGFTAIP